MQHYSIGYTQYIQVNKINNLNLKLFRVSDALISTYKLDSCYNHKDRLNLPCRQ